MIRVSREESNASMRGGIVPILKKIRDFGVPQAIRECLGRRRTLSKKGYGYEDIFVAWILTALCGGRRIHNIEDNRKDLSIIEDLKLPSHDTVGRALKRLAQPVITARSITHHREAKEVFTEYDDNIPLNRMLVRVSKQAGAFEENKSHTLDIDATFISTECRGARRVKGKNGEIDYNKTGFNPMVCFINEMPVHVSMRNGGANARFMLTECLKNCLDLLAESRIKIGRVVSDAAGYNKDTLRMIDSRGIKFVMRFPYTEKMEGFKAQLAVFSDFKPREVKTANFQWDCQVGDIQYTMSHKYFETEEPMTFRVVTMRIPNEVTMVVKDGYERKKKRMMKLYRKGLLKEKGRTYDDVHWKSIDGYSYKFFITNDWDKDPVEIIEEYHKRGNAERQFSFMKNDFGWKWLPFMKMNENTVFFIASALANNVYRGMLREFSRFTDLLKMKGRVTAFIRDFINAVCIRKHDKYIFLGSNIPFEKLI